MKVYKISDFLNKIQAMRFIFFISISTILSSQYSYAHNYYVNQQVSEKELMYPYNLSDFTEITSSKPIHDQPLPFRIPFFGFSFHYVWVQRDGYVSFNKGLLSYKFPIKLPIVPRDPLMEEDPSMIAPWFALQDIPTEVPGAGVYLKIVTLESESNKPLRDKIRVDFRNGMIGASDFEPKFALIITWKNMTMVNKRPEMPLVTNTYQCVLATDEIRTYAMFNYDQIQWITHHDNYEGLRGPPAYVGFNAGNTTRAFEFRPYSQNPRISYLTTRGFGNGFRGRYFFQIDEEVMPGSCVERDLDPNLPDRLPLTFFPKVGNMLGGTEVNVTGPCFSPNSIITCKFENWKTQGIYRGPNHATCISPPVMYNGFVDLTVTVDDRTGFLGRFYIQPPEVDDVIVLDDADHLEEINGMLELRWKPNNLGWDENARVTISLWGYKETDDLYPTLTYIDTLADPGSARLGQRKALIDPKLFSDRKNNQTSDITFGFIAINLTDSSVLGKEVRHSPIIWSRPIPLGWYFKKQWEREYGTNGKWKDHFCQDWFDKEKSEYRFKDKLPQCPCTIREATLDRGVFLSDLDCNVIDRKCDTFHRGAVHCVSTPGISSADGSGQTCCYDDYGELIQTADSMYAGRPSRASSYGKHPFKRQKMIPVLSEWLHDKIPFFFCCKWQSQEDNSKTCQMYNQLRTSQGCQSYKSPAVSSVYGDPHIISFDRHNYTFNGKGEFTLLNTQYSNPGFEIQGRFEQIPRRRRVDPSINATALTAVAARSNSSTIEFRIRPGAARWRYKMYVVVDKEYVFWYPPMKYMNFRGVTLFQPEGIQNMSHLIAMFDSGAGLEVITNDGHMTVHAYAPHSFLNETRGLLGKYSNNVSDDFTLPNGQVIPLQSTSEDIHLKFGMHWRVSELSSLFFHDSKPFSYYDDPSFIPDFGSPPKLPDWAKHLQSDMESICSDSIACQYDYVITLDKDYAKITKYQENYALFLSNEVKKKSVRCPALSRPLNGHKSENRYWPGTIIRFSCDVGYKLVGYETVRCGEDGIWTHNLSGDWVAGNITDADFKCNRI